MAQQTLNVPAFLKAPPNTGDGPEAGESWFTALTKLNAMLTEIYGKANLAAKYVTNAASGASTAAVGDLTGANNVVANYSAIGAANLTTRTAAQMFADMNAIVGQTYEVEIMNSSAGTTTLVGGTGVTISGTATIAASACRWYVVTFNSATTMTFQNAGSGTI